MARVGIYSACVTIGDVVPSGRAGAPPHQRPSRKVIARSIRARDRCARYSRPVTDLGEQRGVARRGYFVAQTRLPRIADSRRDRLRNAGGISRTVESIPFMTDGCTPT